jgi:MtN3 and saliva related transmembrane protein
MFNASNFFGTVAFLLSCIGLIPQIWKSFKTKSTEDISILMLINYLVCSVCWIIYGCYVKSHPVIWSNVAMLVTSFISIVQKYYYDRKTRRI